MPTKDLLDTARRWWLLLAVAGLVGALLGHAVPTRAPEEFRSDVRLLVGPLYGGTDALRASGLLAQTYAAVLTSDEVLRQAAQAGGVPNRIEMEDVRKLVLVTSNDKTRILTIEVTLERPELAQKMATSLTRQIMERVDRDVAQQVRMRKDLERTMGREAALVLGPIGVEGRVTVVDDARAPVAAVPKPVLLYTLLGGVVLAATTLGALLLLASGGRRGAMPGLASLSNRRLLGSCRLDGGGPLRRPRRAVVLRRPASPDALDYRVLAAKAELLAPSSPLRSLAVFGGAHVTGTAEVVANLACAFAHGGRSVVVLDLAADNGVARRLASEDGTRVVQRLGDLVVEMRLIPVGRGQVIEVLSRDPAVRAAPGETPAIADLLQGVGDLVILHAPPLLLEPTTAIVATQVDGVAVVAAECEGDTVIEGMTDVLDALERVGAPVLGAVLALGRPASDAPRMDGVGTRERKRLHVRQAARLPEATETSARGGVPQT